MEKHEIIIAVITIILALSGWGTIMFQYFYNKPMIKGEIVIEIGTGISLNNKDSFIYSPYVFITNIRNNSVYLKSVILEFKYMKEKIKIYPDYTIDAILARMNKANDIIGQTSFKDIADHSLFKHDIEVKYGNPVKGFVSFPMDKKYESEINKSKYKLIIIDVFERKYTIKQKQKSHLVDLDWFEHISGVKIHSPETISPQNTKTKY